MSISNTDDIINTRNVEAEIEELETKLEWFLDEDNDDHGDKEEDFDDYDDLKALRDLKSEAEGYCDWHYGATLIHEDYFVEAMQELCKDIGDLPQEIPSYLEIDWDATAENLKVDYTTVDFDGETYYVR